jgi:fumarate reductase subunit D
MDAIQLIQSNPRISFDDFRNATGLSRRSFYNYKKAAGASDGDRSPREASQLITRRSMRVRTATPDIAGAALVTDKRSRDYILYTLFLAPTIASTTNMYSVLSTITHDYISAFTLTGVFALTAIGFTAAGIRNHTTLWLIVALIVFEGFCNMARIFGGLYDIDLDTARVPLLREVHAILWLVPMKNCALGLGLFTAACIAAVQYSSIREITKKPQTVTIKNNV